MDQILIVTNDTDKFSAFAKRLSAASHYQVNWANSVQAALDEGLRLSLDLMIIDETVDGFRGIDIARKVILKNAFINLAVASSLSTERFHEVGEGLGIMAQLSPIPHRGDAERLLAAMARLNAVK